MNTKQVIVVRKDLKMNRGKEIAQCCHASIAFLTRKLKIYPEEGCVYPDITIKSEVEVEWLKSSYRKVTLQVNSEQELLDIDAAAQKAGIECHLVKDAGLTYFEKPTYTCLALGPDYDEKIDEITKHLKLY